MTTVSREDGIVLVIILLVMTLLLILGTAFLSISSTETLIAMNERNRLQAFFMAEVGIERAIAELSANEAYSGTSGEQMLGPGTFTVTVTNLPPLPDVVEPKQVVATGYVPSSTVSNRAMAQIQVMLHRGSPFKFAMLGIDFVDVENGVRVDSYDSTQGNYDPTTAETGGHIYSHGDITLDANNTVKGNVWAGGTVTYDPVTTTITGAVINNVPPTTFITVDTSYQSSNSNGSGISPPNAYDPGTHDLNVVDTVTLAPGTYYFSRIDLNDGATLEISGPVIIYLTGPLHAVGGGMINTSKNPANLLIISSAAGMNAIELDAGTGEFYGAVYALNGEFDIDTSHWKFFGSVVAKWVDIDDGVEIHYDVALARLSLLTGKFRPTAGTWQELLP